MDKGMAKFLSDLDDYKRGHWTLTMPSEPGVYNICARKARSSIATIVLYQHPITGEITPDIMWCGWYWSVKCPVLPQTPDMWEV